MWILPQCQLYAMLLRKCCENRHPPRISAISQLFLGFLTANHPRMTPGGLINAKRDQYAITYLKWMIFIGGEE